MPEQIDVFYEGWGERWLWGKLVSSTALTGRPVIAFEYSDEAVRKGFELSCLTLPLEGPRLRRDFPAHQLHLPGPVYDALPDGWGMLLMDRLFKRRGLNAARIGPLERLTWVGGNAMGAMTFQPVQAEAELTSQEEIPLVQLAAEVQEVLSGEGGEFLQKLLQMGGSPQGARPKALLYRDTVTSKFTTSPLAGAESWLVKFPARQEHAEVCAIEAVYSACLRKCGIQTPDVTYFALPEGQAAFATRRFDREQGMRVPMQSLAAFTGANYQTPGSLDYRSFLRATQICTNDIREKTLAFERVVFNVVFNNRDDHPKNFAYLMSADGQWTLAPAYDVTYCDGPGGYHQMDVMGEALDIERKHLQALGEQEAELPATRVAEIIATICDVAATFSAIATDLYPGQITSDTLNYIQKQIDGNISRLKG
ncbi:TPA: type II toxin-antitoxin system HipA family toxin [Citrobacter koseri]|uniref:type II toxin-antitoxin system HipA family toxin n=1 Tax=Citrobacter koseri TaxID=545 RepID=UPI000DF1063C|nr:type II toxin-antitoxin system HipA family toxin [Citrobacter koseri]STB31232.1 Serine/threonine-protein kinase HipA [Citrobacter koseri]HBC6075312.1 type II toxin-antitoxin system HipA family toxin [Citrobacter koseri]